jgi:hypothetical protein
VIVATKLFPTEGRFIGSKLTVVASPVLRLRLKFFDWMINPLFLISILAVVTLFRPLFRISSVGVMKRSHTRFWGSTILCTERSIEKSCGAMVPFPLTKDALLGLSANTTFILSTCPKVKLFIQLSGV